MPIISSKIASTYARELLPVGEGYALWQPDPDDDGGQLNAGDVGYVEDGKFHPLFSTLDSQQGSRYASHTYGLPTSFQPITSMPGVLYTDDVYHQVYNVAVVRSPALVPVTKSQGELGGESAISTTEVTLKFEPMPPSGAVLIPKTPVEKRIWRNTQIITQYMRTSFDSWVHFATTYSPILTEEDIMFVIGTTKTAAWTAIAFDDLPIGPRKLMMAGRLYAFETGTVNVKFNDCNPPPEWLNGGRSEPIRRPDGTMQDAPLNHCLFIHYFKMKRSGKWFMKRNKPIKAAAGPHNLPRGPDGDGGAAVPVNYGRSGNGLVEEKKKLATIKAYDPVAPLLDYILEHSKADAAIASTLHLKALFKAHGYSPDIRKFLENVKPAIEVDEDGVGTLGGLDLLDEKSSTQKHDSPRGKTITLAVNAAPARVVV